MMLNAVYLEANVLAVMVLHYGICITIKKYIKKDTYRKCVVAFNNIYCKLFKIQREESISTACVDNNDDQFMVISICLN